MSIAAVVTTRVKNAAISSVSQSHARTFSDGAEPPARRIQAARGIGRELSGFKNRSGSPLNINTADPLEPFGAVCRIEGLQKPKQ